jgi:hypothetical protein
MKMRKRVNRRGIKPTSIKSRHIPQDLLKNVTTSDITFTFAHGAVITLNSHIYSSADREIRLGTAPYMVAMFEADGLGSIAPGTNQIPMDVTGLTYIVSQFAMPEYSVGGKRRYSVSGGYIPFATDGNDLVWKTTITNNSGVDKTVTMLIQPRVLISRGGK